MKKIINKNIIFTLVSLIIAVVYILTVDVYYKETYNEVLAFLGFFVVLIPMIFSTNWKWGFISSVSSIILLIIFWYLFWAYKDIRSNDFSFENQMEFKPFWFEVFKGFVTAIIMRALYSGFRGFLKNKVL